MLLYVKHYAQMCNRLSCRHLPTHCIASKECTYSLLVESMSMLFRI